MKNAPPGHRFRLYFSAWKDDFTPEETGKKECVAAATDIAQNAADIRRLRDRQLGLAMLRPDQTAIYAGVSEAPFVTGMGMEHPLENGFAFLDPYGLPYLPGSSVKGVVRRAAEELCLSDFERSEWSLLDVWWLFGFDEKSAFFQPEAKGDPESIIDERKRWLAAYRSAATQVNPDDVESFVKAALSPDDKKIWLSKPAEFLVALLESIPLRRSVCLRGSISFWDVLPEPRDNNLRVDIMNPHYSHYYQADNDGSIRPPGDWDNPNPIFFLAMPPGTKFRFILRFEPIVSLPESYRNRWKNLMAMALDHAFSWLGFGAKTSLGYGLMREDLEDPQYQQKLLEQENELREEEHKRQEEAERRRKFEDLPEFEKLIFRLEHDADENFVHNAYQIKLHTCPESERKRLAAAFKLAFIRLKKWDGRQSPKQTSKNVEIKNILGESL
jgi:CRISPR-associated protein Cmr6